MFSLSFLLAITASLVSATTTDVTGNLLGYSYTSLGCYPDSSTSRVLRAASFSDPSNFKLEDCTSFCSAKGYEYVGIEYGRECYCDWKIHNNPPVDPGYTNCNSICTGRNDTYCGGPNHVQIFFRDPRYLPPTINPSANGYTFTGCYTDSVSSRTLERPVPISGGVTVAKCTAACKSAGFTYAGVEFGNECFCGNSIRSPGFLTYLDQCDMQCAGDSSQLCGAADRLLVYHSIL